MNAGLRYFSLLLFTGLFSSCSNSDAYEKGIRHLDSLEGALGLISKEIREIDTAQVQQAMERFETYRLFIQTLVKDTISTEEAQALQRFFRSGSELTAYSKNRNRLLARSDLMHTQRNKLRHDLVEGIPEEAEWKNALNQEKLASDALCKSMLDQQKKYYNAMQEFKLSLPETEAFIRKHNHGELPTLIKQKQTL